MNFCRMACLIMIYSIPYAGTDRELRNMLFTQEVNARIHQEKMLQVQTKANTEYLPSVRACELP